MSIECTTMLFSDPEEKVQFYGRMLESVDIERAIESGQFKTLDDVLTNVRARSAAINAGLIQAGFFGERRCAAQTD